jgi:hypothetical protein
VEPCSVVLSEPKGLDDDGVKDIKFVDEIETIKEKECQRKGSKMR